MNKINKDRNTSDDADHPIQFCGLFYSINWTMVTSVPEKKVVEQYIFINKVCAPTWTKEKNVSQAFSLW